MRAQTAVEILVPREMSPEARQRLIDELHGVRCRIVEGAQNKRSLASHVVSAGAEHGCVLLHRGEGGRITSFFAMQLFELSPGGVTTAIFRGELGTLAEDGGGDLVLRCVLERLIRYMLAHPGRPVYCLCSLAHPSSYALFARFIDITHTSPAESRLAGADAILSEVASALGGVPDEQGSPFLFEAGQRSSAPPGCDFLHVYEIPAVRYFLSAQSGAADAHGLITLVPLSLGGMMRAAARHAGPGAR